MAKGNSIGTTLIIGNGFDLNLGMDTSYRSFYNKIKSANFFADNARNPLLSYIYEKGEREYWYAFEYIIREFAIYGKESQTLLFCQKLLEDIDKLQKLDDNALTRIPRYQELVAISSSLGRLIEICSNYVYTNIELQERIRPLCHQIRSDMSEYANRINQMCVEAIDALSENLAKFVNVARPNNEYSAALKIMCALLGCDGKDYDKWAENILGKYCRKTDEFLFSEFKLVSFNYTDPMYSITQKIERKTGCALTCRSTYLHDYIYNIHGTWDGTIAFGTDETAEIPKELWALRKSSKIEENAKKKFYDILCKSKRIVIFGHSIHGIDFEYYEEFFKKKNLTSEIYILSNTEASLTEIKRGLELKGVSLRAKYIISDFYNDDFRQLCELINSEQHSVLNELFASISSE